MSQHRWPLRLLVLGLLLTGCVPIRQRVTSGMGFLDREAQARAEGTASRSVPPGERGAAGKDAWKSEMEGVASWYGRDFNGHLTSSGEVYDMYEYTAAHKSLPLGTVVRVINTGNGKSVQVRINDRGPFVEGRVIDLSRTAGRALGIREEGTAKVRLEIVRWPIKEDRER